MNDNKIKILTPTIDGYKILYRYQVIGSWAEAFKLDETFFVEYSCDISNVPESVAVIPLLANLLPMAWIYDAEIQVSVCDKAFYDSVEAFKQGYRDMYPMMTFAGKLTAENLEENHPGTSGGAAAFFSGGVDAFNTLTCHAEEYPTLLTLWGADVTLEDTEGWKKVATHLDETAREFSVEFVTIKTSFRRFLKEAVLHPLVFKQSGDGWWHGFQHGIGIISHAAPVAYAMEKETIYFASSFTAADRGKVTCASDPTIDNFVRFGDTHIVHDGYEFTRQMKIHNITEFSQKYNQKIPLRVCWESTGGSNCCKCEKCWRTILAVYAEGENPREYGFQYTDAEFSKLAKKMRFSTDKMLSDLRYGPIQDALHKNRSYSQVSNDLKWFYKTKRNRLGKHPVLLFVRKVKGKAVSVLKKLK